MLVRVLHSNLTSYYHPEGDYVGESTALKPDVILPPWRWLCWWEYCTQTWCHITTLKVTMLVRVLHSNLTSYYHPEGDYVGESTALKPDVILPPWRWLCWWEYCTQTWRHITTLKVTMLVRVLHSNLTSYYHPKGHYVGESTALKPDVILPPWRSLCWWEYCTQTWRHITTLKVTMLVRVLHSNLSHITTLKVIMLLRVLHSNLSHITTLKVTMLVRVLHSNLTSYYHPEGDYVGESTALKPDVILPPWRSLCWWEYCTKTWRHITTLKVTMLVRVLHSNLTSYYHPEGDYVGESTALKPDVILPP